MNHSKRDEVEAALRILESAGFDVKNLWRELTERRPPEVPLLTLDMTVDGLLLVAPDPLLALRHFGAALTTEIERLAGEIEDLTERKRNFPLRSAGKAELIQKIAALDAQLRSAKFKRHEVLEKTKELAEQSRRAESAKVYDAMRISKLGVRGEKHDPGFDNVSPIASS
jgi:hypothetical protein